jgi:hypothetical protein
MRNALLIVCALLGFLHFSAQYEDFDGLRSSGLLSAEYLSSSSEKFYSDIANDARLDTMTTKEREAMISFYLRTHFLIGGDLRLGSFPFIKEYTNTESRDFWIHGKGRKELDTFIGYFHGILPVFEKGRNLFIPEVHMAYLF